MTFARAGGAGCATPAAEGKAKAAPGGGEEDLLQLALEDCARWADLEPRSAEASRKKAEIERRIKDRQEKLKEEVMGKRCGKGRSSPPKLALR